MSNNRLANLIQSFNFNADGDAVRINDEVLEGTRVGITSRHQVYKVAMVDSVTTFPSGWPNPLVYPGIAADTIIAIDSLGALFEIRPTASGPEISGRIPYFIGMEIIVQADGRRKVWGNVVDPDTGAPTTAWIDRTADNIPDGEVNLYYSDEKVDKNVSSKYISRKEYEPPVWNTTNATRIYTKSTGDENAFGLSNNDQDAIFLLEFTTPETHPTSDAILLDLGGDVDGWTVWHRGSQILSEVTNSGNQVIGTVKENTRYQLVLRVVTFGVTSKFASHTAYLNEVSSDYLEVGTPILLGNYGYNDVWVGGSTSRVYHGGSSSQADGSPNTVDYDSLPGAEVFNAYWWGGTYTELPYTPGKALEANFSDDLILTKSWWDSDVSTDLVKEGDVNLYYTTERADSDFSAKTTDDLPEGDTNLYFTDARVENAVETDYQKYTRDGGLEVSSKFYVEATEPSGTYSWSEISTGRFGRIIDRNGFSANSQGITYTNTATGNIAQKAGSIALLIEVAGELTEEYLTNAGTLHIKDDASELSGIVNAGQTNSVVGQWIIVKPTKVEFYGPVGSSSMSRFAYIEFSTVVGDNWYRPDDVNNIFYVYIVTPQPVRLIHDNTDTMMEGRSNLFFTEQRVRNAIGVHGDLQYDSETGKVVFFETNTQLSYDDNLEKLSYVDEEAGTTEIDLSHLANNKGALSELTDVTINANEVTRVQIGHIANDATFLSAGAPAVAPGSIRVLFTNPYSTTSTSGGGGTTDTDEIFIHQDEENNLLYIGMVAQNNTQYIRIIRYSYTWDAGGSYRFTRQGYGYFLKGADFERTYEASSMVSDYDNLSLEPNEFMGAVFDAEVINVSPGHVLTYDGAIGRWTPSSVVKNIEDLSNVNVDRNPADKSSITYDQGTGQWVEKPYANNLNDIDNVQVQFPRVNDLLTFNGHTWVPVDRNLIGAALYTADTFAELPTVNVAIGSLGQTAGVEPAPVEGADETDIIFNQADWQYILDTPVESEPQVFLHGNWRVSTSGLRHNPPATDLDTVYGDENLAVNLFNRTWDTLHLMREDASFELINRTFTWDVETIELSTRPNDAITTISWELLQTNDTWIEGGTITTASESISVGSRNAERTIFNLRNVRPQYGLYHGIRISVNDGDWIDGNFDLWGIIVRMVPTEGRPFSGNVDHYIYYGGERWVLVG